MRSGSFSALRYPRQAQRAVMAELSELMWR
jgi:hypothetical protein